MVNKSGWDELIATHGPEAVLVVLEALKLKATTAEGRDVALPADKWELQKWIKDVTGWHIPGRAVCQHHQAPLDFVWAVWNEEVSECVVLANRGGGKTFDLAALHLADGFFKDGHETSHFGAIDVRHSVQERHYRPHVVVACLNRPCGHAGELDAVFHDRE